MKMNLAKFEINLKYIQPEINNLFTYYLWYVWIISSLGPTVKKM